MVNQHKMDKQQVKDQIKQLKTDLYSARVATIVAQAKTRDFKYDLQKLKLYYADLEKQKYDNMVENVKKTFVLFSTEVEPDPEIDGKLEAIAQEINNKQKQLYSLKNEVFGSMDKELKLAQELLKAEAKLDLLKEEANWEERYKMLQAENEALNAKLKKL